MTLYEETIKELKSCKDLAHLAEIKSKTFQKISQEFEKMKAMLLEEKKIQGPKLQKLKQELEQLFEEKNEEFLLEKDALLEEKQKEFLAFKKSYFLKEEYQGGFHPLTQVREELEILFHSMGFKILTGPHIEKEFYNFTALNIPDDHPARDSQDTFWIDENTVLRTHTSNTQVRAMESFGAPLRGISPGRVFRNERVDASHEISFYQMEGLLIDENIHVGHLLSMTEILLEEIFQKKITYRVRPGFFPFVEPGFEIDVECSLCNGGGCSVCKQTGWVETLPCGLVHPKVLEYGKIKKEYSGFAFGLGLDRLVMMKYKIPDIRLIYSGDLRFLKQF